MAESKIAPVSALTTIVVESSYTGAGVVSVSELVVEAELQDVAAIATAVNEKTLRRAASLLVILFILQRGRAFAAPQV